MVTPANEKNKQIAEIRSTPPNRRRSAESVSAVPIAKKASPRNTNFGSSHDAETTVLPITSPTISNPNPVANNGDRPPVGSLNKSDLIRCVMLIRPINRVQAQEHIPT